MEIISLPIVVDEKQVDSRYRLVIVGSQRARQLMEGNGPALQTRYKKATTIALEEFLESKLEFYTGKEARLAQREARRLREEEMRHQALQAKERQITSEISKELSVYVDDTPHVKEEAESEE
jgi:DNA-directed RNA polymerase omega subunit